jgi:hypothetical protein
LAIRFIRDFPYGPFPTNGGAQRSTDDLPIAAALAPFPQRFHKPVYCINKPIYTDVSCKIARRKSTPGANAEWWVCWMFSGRACPALPA